MVEEKEQDGKEGGEHGDKVRKNRRETARVEHFD